MNQEKVLERPKKKWPQQACSSEGVTRGAAAMLSSTPAEAS